MSNSPLYSLQCKEHNQGQDWISKLPDEMIVSILSFMNVKNSARTSILSSRWRHLWTNLADLNFNASSTMLKNLHLFDHHHKFVKDEFSENVNQVLNFHCEGISINNFRVCFLLDKDYDSHIDEWVKFAFSKRVKTLELDFFWVKFAFSRRVMHPKLDSICATSNYYPLGRHELIEHLTYEGGMRFLTTLHLSCVHVIGDVLEFILSRCRLEQLSISFSYGLERLSIENPSLKYLKINWCFDLRELELDARDLVCFEYIGRSANIAYNHVPSLLEVCFTTFEYLGWPPYIWQFKCFSTQLIKLSLQLGEVYPGDLALNFGGFPNLKYLELKVFAERYNNDTLVACALLAQVCPSLHELKLQVTWERSKVEWKFNDYELGLESNIETRITTYACLGEAKCVDYYDDQEDGMNFETKLNHWAKELKHSPENPLPNLTSVEFVGFIGSDTDVKLVMHIVEAAPNLKTICLNSTPLYGVCCTHRQEASKKLARKLAMGFLSTIHFKVL